MTIETAAVPGTPDNAAIGSGSPALTPAPWTDGLSDETHKSLVANKGWKSPADALTSYSDLERKLTEATTPKSYKPDAYKFTAPANAADIGYNDGLATAFRDFVAAKGIDPSVASELHDMYVGNVATAVGANSEASAAQVEARLSDTHASLTREWGSPEGPAFQRNVLLAERAMNQLGLQEELLATGVLIKDANGTHVANPKMFAALAKVGNALYSEDRVYGEASIDRNPFAAETMDLTAQGRLVKDDPAKALLLIDALPAASREKLSYLRAQVAARAGRA